MPVRLSLVFAILVALVGSLTVLPATVGGGGRAIAAAAATVVDELSVGFTPRGSGWRDGAGGYAGHHYWMDATRGQTSRGGTWRATLPRAGRYRVQVKIPRWHATTKAARYTVVTASGRVRRTVDQSRARGSWADLGTFRLSTEVSIRLSAQTGDRRNGRKVAFDAVRVVSRTQAPPPVSPPPATPPPATPPPPVIPAPPVVTDIRVDPGRTDVRVAFSLDAPGPARVEYRQQGSGDWLIGAVETGFDSTDYQEVITDLRRGTDYELRIIARNEGGTTVSPTIAFATSQRPPGGPGGLGGPGD
jgi:hypothetical protein